MKCIIQRVAHASVRVHGAIVGEIDKGLMLLVGFGKEDFIERPDKPDLISFAEKIINMRIFSNPEGKFDLSLLDLKAEILLVPQFTLFADTSKGRRPEFFSAMAPAQASQCFDKLVQVFESKNLAKVAKGKFGADMKVELLNDGPVTISMDFF